MFIFVDYEDCENEGDLVIFVQMVMLEVINFMVMYGCGLVCLLMLGECLDVFGLFLMIFKNFSCYEIVFIMFIEVCEGVMIGIFVYDCVYIIVVVIDLIKGVVDIVMFGYVFLLCVCEGGVLVCVGYIEVVVDILCFVGLNLVGVICEIMNDDGIMVCLFDLVVFV